MTEVKIKAQISRQAYDVKPVMFRVHMPCKDGRKANRGLGAVQNRDHSGKPSYVLAGVSTDKDSCNAVGGPGTVSDRRNAGSYFEAVARVLCEADVMPDAMRVL